MPTRNLNDRFCAGAKARPGEIQTDYFDEQTPGLALRVSRAGSKSWTFHFTWADKRARMTFGTYPATSLRSARTNADEAKAALETGNDPRTLNGKGGTFKDKAEEYLVRECGMRRDAGGNASFEGANINSGDQRLSVFERLVYPVLGQRPFEDIKRSEIVSLLDEIEDDSGPRMAHVTLAYLSRLFNWHASRSDDFRSPIVRGMGRVKPRERERDRILTDEEIKAVWNAGNGVFNRFVCFLLLTAVRRSEASMAHSNEITDGLWLIPAERMKGKVEFVIPLSPEALAFIADRPGFAFSTDGGATPISGFSKFKAALDKASGVADWTLHDCRRTARSLLSRAGVSPDIAERCLAHKIGGVRGVYDRYAYLSEKRDALTKLAALIGGIVQ